MSWIETIDYQNANPRLKGIYDRIKGPGNNIDNVLLIHSLRPHTLIGHMTLYKNVLHNSNNTLPKWYLELIGVYVSHLNQCDYCVQHHYEGMHKLMNDDARSSELMQAINKQELQHHLEPKYHQGLAYANRITLQLGTMKKQHVDELRSAGFTDGEVLELNQVVSYFNYVNRTVLGLGVNTEGDIIGLSPGESDNPTNWSHH